MANAQSKRLTPPNLHVGTMGWSYTFWKGAFYPEKLTAKKFLSYYATQFNTVEADSTFYRIPSAETLAEWKNQTPYGFCFSLKFPQKITHFKMLQGAQEDTTFFLDRVALLNEKLGVLLLQLPPNFKQEHFPSLQGYLQALPKSYHYAVEFRNKSLLTPETYNLLKQHNIALAWVDSTKITADYQPTADFIYLRWEGDRKTVNGELGKTETDQTAHIQQWITQLKPHLQNQTPIYGYFSKYYSGNPIQDANQLLNLLR